MNVYNNKINKIQDMIRSMRKDAVATLKAYDEKGSLNKRRYDADIKELDESNDALLKIREDLIKIKHTKKYNSRSRENMQLFKGIGEVINAVFELFSTAIVIIISPIIFLDGAYSAIKNKDPRVFLEALAIPPLFIINNGLALVKGLAKIATFPLTILLRKPIRSIITSFNNSSEGSEYTTIPKDEEVKFESEYGSTIPSVLSGYEFARAGNFKIEEIDADNDDTLEQEETCTGSASFLRSMPSL